MFEGVINMERPISETDAKGCLADNEEVMVGHDGRTDAKGCITVQIDLSSRNEAFCFIKENG